MVPDDGVGAEVTVTGTVLALDGNLATVGLEVLHEGQKVLGAARVQVELDG